MWPIFINNYTTSVAFPGMEEVSMLITALGAALMAAVGHNRQHGNALSGYVLLGSTSYMTFHYIVFDLAGWTYMRSRIAREMAKNAKFNELMMEDWTEPKTTIMTSEARYAESDANVPRAT